MTEIEQPKLRIIPLGGVDEFGKNITANNLKNGKFDTIVIATGGTWITPPIPGADLPHVFQATDILMNGGKAAGKQNAVIIGGGTVG